MVPALVLVVSFVALTALCHLGVERLRRPVLRLRLSVALLFVATGSAHFMGLREDLVRMVPPFLPSPELLVTLTGVLELVLAAGLLHPRTARASSLSLAALLVAMFPANVYAALEGIPLGGRPPTPLPLRAALQIFFLAATLGAAALRRPRPVRQG